MFQSTCGKASKMKRFFRGKQLIGFYEYKFDDDVFIILDSNLAKHDTWL
jgi:hypothetical protein